jgi:hypothetical protein
VKDEAATAMPDDAGGDADEVAAQGGAAGFAVGEAVQASGGAQQTGG